MRGVITKRAVLWLAVVSAMSLVALAVLQYRWVTELGMSQRALLDAAMERGTRNFRDEFNHEVAGVVLKTLGGGERTPEGLALRYRNGVGAIQHPQIASRIYLLTAAEVFEATQSEFRRVTTWPAYLDALRSQLNEPTDGPPPQPFWNESPPVIGLPVRPDPPRREAASDDDGPPPPGPRGDIWVLFEFDGNYIRKQFIPQLIAKYFGPDYLVEVASLKAGLQPLLGAPIEQPDATVGFFEVHLENPRDRPPREGGGGRPRDDKKRGPSRARGEPPSREPPIFETSRWQLMVKHRAGSLDLEVQRARRRNLGVTLAVLIIMGLSSAALVVALNRAEQLNRMQMDFVAGVSHELRTPLAVIRTAGENLADGVVANDKQTRSYGALIRDEGKRLTNMVEQILGFAGVESGRAPYMFVPESPARLIGQALAEAGATLENVQVETQIEPGLPNVMGDAASLSHCLQNLLGNAVKYGDGKWAKVEAARKGNEVEFAVSDHGPGVEPSEQGRLFDPFYRGRRAVMDQIHGLGIGLSLVKRVAEAHGGRAEVINLAAGGARFSMFIPIQHGGRQA